jgi:CRP/FNR family transcriptional regulator, cyclic AMP receptor protein
MKNACYLPLTDIQSVLPILNRISILGGLTDLQLHTVFRHLETISYHAGERIFEQGDQSSHIYVIQSGRVKIVADVDGTPYELMEYGVGQCFGETSMIGILPHSASAVVTENVDLMVLSNESLHALFKEDPRLFGMLILNIAREACRRLHKSGETLLHYARAKPPIRDARSTS